MLPARLHIPPLTEPFNCTGGRALRLPGSKSLTNRALVLAALADGASTLTGVLFSDDTRVMLANLEKLGFLDQARDVDAARCTVTIHGQAGRIPAAGGSGGSGGELFCGNSGTTIRFLTALCCLGDPGSRYTLTGIPRMLERPIGELVDMLRRLGARIDYAGREGFPPIVVHGGGIRGGELTLQPTLSSQYITAALQIAPYLPGGLTLRFDGPVTSRPYVEMTAATMRAFGVQPVWQGDAIAVPAGVYAGRPYAIEPDASNASYFLAAAAITPGSHADIADLTAASVQGDAKFTAVLERMGSPLHAVDVDLNDMPDMAQTLAVVALFAQGTTVIRNVGNLRVKETDRMAALQNELTKFGAKVEITGDDLAITPPPEVASKETSHLPFPPGGEVVIETYDDHRMAMAFAVAGLGSHRLPGRPRVVIDDPACVNKTFPNFFDKINELRPPPPEVQGVKSE